jgi:REP element-mobilizing transposase RayT
MSDYLFLCQQLYFIKIHSFVLMPNHFHLLVTAPQGNLSKFLLYFMRETSREITRRSKRINQTFGSRNHKCLIDRYSYYINCYKYVYQNPLRAKLTRNVEDYEFSTLAGLLGSTQLVIPVAEDTLLFDPTPEQSFLDWLNEWGGPQYDEDIRLALKRSIMEFKASKTTGKLSLLADGVIY